LSNSLTASLTTRELSTQEQGSQTGASTGQSKPGTQAIGTLTFQNYTPNPVTVPAGTRVTSTNGQQVETDTTIVIPPDPPVIPGVASVSSHAVNTGKDGNIPAMGINTTYNSPDIKVFNESAFSGGSDNQTTHTVQQSDIDSVAKALETSLKQKALSNIQKQLTSGEQLVAPTPQCSTNVTSNPGVGESAANFTVTASLTCSDSAYNPQTVLLQAEEQLKKEAAQQLPGFVLNGKIDTKVEKVTPGQDGNIDVQVSASGTWKYQFTTAQKSKLARDIAGKTKTAAQDLLSRQEGVTGVSISISGPIIDLSGGNRLPDDPNAITING